MESALKVDGLDKYFGKKKILDNISFELKSGEVFGFLGPNGAGKTTTIKIITGFLQSDSGSIEICGYNLKKNYEKAMENIGAIVENPEMYKKLSGECNLKMYARLQEGVTKDRIDEVVKMVGMQNHINQKVKSYSLGMKQRLGLAQAILHKPKVLILDEPTNGLDPVGIKELRNILKELASKENIAVMVSSHLLAEMEMMCDRVAIINCGKVIEIKTIKDITHNSKNSVSYRFYTTEIAKAKKLLQDDYSDKIMSENEEYIEMKISEDIAPIVNILLAKNDIPITQMVKSEVTLEQAFIDITGGGGVIA